MFFKVSTPLDTPLSTNVLLRSMPSTFQFAFPDFNLCLAFVSLKISFSIIKRIACVSGVAPTGFNVKRLWCLVFFHASDEWFVKTLCLPISWNLIDDQTPPKSVLWIFLLPELQIFAPRIIGILQLLQIVLQHGLKCNFLYSDIFFNILLPPILGKMSTRTNVHNFSRPICSKTDPPRCSFCTICRHSEQLSSTVNETIPIGNKDYSTLNVLRNLWKLSKL